MAAIVEGCNNQLQAARTTSRRAFLQGNGNEVETQKVDRFRRCRGSAAARGMCITSETGAFTKGSDICLAAEWIRSAETEPGFPHVRCGCSGRSEHYPSAGAQARARAQSSVPLGRRPEW